MTKKSHDNQQRATRGFTLIEILLVTVIIGIMIAVIVPRAWRANVSAKYNLLRQNCTELASWANEWAERQLESQDSNDTANLNNYIETLGGGGAAENEEWVGESDDNNWNNNDPDYLTVDNKVSNSSYPTAKVQDIMPSDKMLKNPFNGTSLFSSVNDCSGGAVVSGAVACAWQNDSSVSPTYRYYALIFLGTDSTSNSTFHAGQGTTLEGLRNGVFLAGLEE